MNVRHRYVLLNWLLVLACGGLAAAIAAPAAAQERILNYEVELDVLANGEVEVAEYITVRAEGRQIRRGIYRDIPTRYKDRFGNNVVVELSVLGVERNGEIEDWFTERRSNGLRINTGGDDFLPQLPGEYRFTLRYRTTRQLGFFEQHDELYWSAIGTGFEFAIDSGRVDVRLPQPVPVEQLHAEGYTGPQGAKGQDYEAHIEGPGHASWRPTRRLAAGEGMTVALTFPKGLIPEPTAGQRFAWLLKDNRGILVAIGGFTLLLAFCVLRWRQVGRDPRRGVVIARYEPPSNRSPAELRFVQRRSYDMRCFTADLLALAVDGQVAIDRQKRTLRSDRWTLARTPGSQRESLRFPSASTLLSRLFPGSSQTIELDKRNASQLQAVRMAHTQTLDKQLHGRYFHRNGGSATLAFFIALATGVLAFAVSGGAGVIAIGVLCFLMLVTVIAFTHLVQAPTAEGRRLMDEIEGLKLYLSVAERDELKNVQGPGEPPQLDARRYEELLPYAVALDVEEAWTRKFTAAVGVAAAAAVTAGIAWYRGGGIDSLGSLANAVGSGLSSSIASASTPPGSSSGSGGGGSSGGGGGGGGGGGR